MGWLSGDRVLERLRGVLEGRVDVRLADPAISASGVDHGIVAFDLGGMRVVFYFDCGDLDYCEWAETPAGDRGEFSRWYDEGDEPVARLTEIEQEQLRQRLVEAA